MKKFKLIIFAGTLLFVSCQDFLDINKDPNNPTDPAINQLIPGIAYDIADDFSLAYGRLGFPCAVYSHQIVTVEPDYDVYDIKGSSYAVTTYWKDLYAGPLQDIQLLINTGEQTHNLIYAGIGKVLKAYTFSQMVDLWGNIPYSQSSVQDINYPEFDTDQDIYASLFQLLDSAIANLQNTSAANEMIPGFDDVIYSGDADKWLKAAKTLKLKLYNQVRLVDAMYNQAEVDSLLLHEDELIGPGDDFMVPFGTLNSPDTRHPSFVSEYVGTQISNFISPWFFEILTGQNPDIFDGISDPRVPYYWVNQLSGNAPENSPEYKDGDFNSVYFGSVGTNRNHAGRASFTMMGIYVCGGKYDDGTGGGPLGTADGTGAAPQRFITYADELFIEAELIQVGKITGDARATLEAAMDASFDQVDMVVAMVAPNQAVPSIWGSDSVSVNAYKAAVLAEYDAGDNNKKLEIIMTEKWISNYGNSVDQYTDYRRTGYPVLFDPNSNGGMQSGGPDGSGPVPTVLNRDYPLSFPYDADEITLNKKAPAQKIIGTSRVFWDIN